MKQKNSPIKYTDLSSFEQSLVVLYDLDLEKDKSRLTRLVEQATIDYYLTDIYYLVVKRYFEHERKTVLSDEELERIIRDKKIFIGSIPKEFLKDEDIERISVDLDYLAKYNELFEHLPGSSELLSAITEVYSGGSKKIMSSFSSQAVKKHILLDHMGMNSFLKTRNKSLDSRLDMHRKAKERECSKAKRLIEDYKAKYSA